MYIHKQNIINKIKNNYRKKSREIEEFYNKYYKALRDQIDKIIFDNDKNDNFKRASLIFTDYYKKLLEFSWTNRISSQSKLASSFLEEINTYLFMNLISKINQKTDLKLDIFNKKIYSGLTISKTGEIQILTKDVDFCIGKKFEISINNDKKYEIVIPIISVEVKTYLDATMFGEVRYSSSMLKKANLGTKIFVFVGRLELNKNHILNERNNYIIDDIFVFFKQKGENSYEKIKEFQFDWKTIKEYWNEIFIILSNFSKIEEFKKTGRILRHKK